MITCPLCGWKLSYLGISKAECANPYCINYNTPVEPTKTASGSIAARVRALDIDIFKEEKETEPFLFADSAVETPTKEELGVDIFEDEEEETPDRTLPQRKNAGLFGDVPNEPTLKRVEGYGPRWFKVVQLGQHFEFINIAVGDVMFDQVEVYPGEVYPGMLWTFFRDLAGKSRDRCNLRFPNSLDRHQIGFVERMSARLLTMDGQRLVSRLEDASTYEWLVENCVLDVTIGNTTVWNGLLFHLVEGDGVPLAITEDRLVLQAGDYVQAYLNAPHRGYLPNGARIGLHLSGELGTIQP